MQVVEQAATVSWAAVIIGIAIPLALVLALVLALRMSRISPIQTELTYLRREVTRLNEEVERLRELVEPAGVETQRESTEFKRG